MWGELLYLRKLDPEATEKEIEQLILEVIDEDGSVHWDNFIKGINMEDDISEKQKTFGKDNLVEKSPKITRKNQLSTIKYYSINKKRNNFKIIWLFLIFRFFKF